MTTSPVLLPALPLAMRATDISSHLRIAVYDCLYIALAEQEGCDFITADEKLVNNVQKHFPFVRFLSAR